MKISPVGAELFHAERRTDMTKDNGRLSQFCEKRLKIIENRVTATSVCFTSLSGTLGMPRENEWLSLTVGILLRFYEFWVSECVLILRCAIQ